MASRPQLDTGVVNLDHGTVGGLSGIDEHRKFILVTVHGRTFFVHGPLEQYRYHAQLLYGFCIEKNLAVTWTHQPDLAEVFESGVRTAGGGWMKKDIKDRQLTLYGYSTAYGRFDRGLLQEMLGAEPFFHGVRVIIR